MATTEPLTGITVQDQNDPAQGGLQIGNLAKGLAPYGVLTYDSSTSRDSATSSFISAGGTMRSGMLCYVTADKVYYRWSTGSSAWLWAPWGQGQIGRVSWSDTGNSSTNGMTPLAATATGLPAFNISMATIPANRNIRVSFTGSIMTDSANTAYGFVMNTAGFQKRGVIQIPMGSTTSSPVPQTFSIVHEFSTATTTSPATSGITAGGRFGGTGNCYLVAKSATLDDPTQLLVEDLGAV